MTSDITLILRFLSILGGGAMAGILGSLTGLGGATVLVPLLTLFYGIPIYFATGASLISTIATSAGSASGYTKHKIANIKIGVGLEIATTAGAIVGSLTIVAVHEAHASWIIYVLFGIVLLGSLIPTIQRSSSEEPLKRKPDWSTRLFQLAGEYYDTKLKKKISYEGVRWWLAEIIMFFAGVISGLLGIGSGALKVLGMDWAMNLPMKVTTTTSNFMIGITAATGSSIYWYEGYIQLFIAGATAIGVVIGAYIGSRLLLKITNKNIRWIFFSILSFLGVEMLLEGLDKAKVLVIATYIEEIISVVVAIAMISGLFLKTKRGENAAKAA